MPYRYYVVEHDGAGDPFELSKLALMGFPYSGRMKLDEIDLMVLAKIAARDYHNNHGGLGSAWPLTFVLLEGGHLLPDGEIGRCKVERFQAPDFSAKVVKQEGGS